MVGERRIEPLVGRIGVTKTYASSKNSEDKFVDILQGIKMERRQRAVWYVTDGEGRKKRKRSRSLVEDSLVLGVATGGTASDNRARYFHAELCARGPSGVRSG